MQDMMTSRCFDRLRQKHGAAYEAFFASKVVAVSGDTSQPQLGLSEADERLLTTCVDIILNNAASVKFDDHIADAAAKNISSALHCAALARACRRLQVLVHTSTSYANSHVYPRGRSTDSCETEWGTRSRDQDAQHTHANLVCREVAERVYFDSAAAHREYREVMEAAKAVGVCATGTETSAGAQRGAAAAKTKLGQLEVGVLRRYPNTYCWSKAVAEAVLRAACNGNAETDSGSDGARQSTKRSIPLAIVRPSIVSAALREPFPGWIDSKDASGGYFMLYGVGGVRCTLIDKGCVDIVPVDVVANSVLLAALCHRGRGSGNRPSCSASASTSGTLVCHVGTSDDNPLLKSEVMPCVYRYWQAAETRHRLSLPVGVPGSDYDRPRGGSTVTGGDRDHDHDHDDQINLPRSLADLWSGPFGHTFSPARERLVFGLRMRLPRLLMLAAAAALWPLALLLSCLVAALSCVASRQGSVVLLPLQVARAAERAVSSARKGLRKGAKLLDVGARARGLFTYFFTHTFVFKKAALAHLVAETEAEIQTQTKKTPASTPLSLSPSTVATYRLDISALHCRRHHCRSSTEPTLTEQYSIDVSPAVLHWPSYLARGQWGLQNYVMGESTAGRPTDHPETLVMGF